MIEGRFADDAISGVVVSDMCKSGIDQIAYHFGIGRHGWPPLRTLYVKPNTSNNTQFQTIPQVVWDFFKEHPKVYTF